MKPQVLGAVFANIAWVLAGCGAEPTAPSRVAEVDNRPSLRAALETLAQEAGDPLFRQHFRSMLHVIDAGDSHRPGDTENINELWQAFADLSSPGSPRLRDGYLSRSRQLIVSWASPTDGQVSFTWLTLPADWKAERPYPLYVGLHGLWDIAADRLEYLNYPFQHPGSSFAFEDGYLISPWGRGNQWYRGIAETDIWECVAAIKSLVRVDEDRQYLSGHSMGGYGAWHLALNSASTWAALGVHAGALGYSQGELTPTAAATLRSMPTYFVVGTSDGLLGVNQTAHQLLRDAGNPHLAFVTFPGGHDYRQEDVERMYLWLRDFSRAERR